MSQIPDSDPLFSEDSNSIVFKADHSPAVIIGALVNTILGAYITFSLLTLSQEHTARSTRRIIFTVLAALSLSSGCCACQLLTSQIRFSSTSGFESDVHSFVGFDSGFIALSVFIPTLVIVSAFFLLDLRSSHDNVNVDKSLLWKCSACGLLVGLAVSFMHYCPFFSLPHFSTAFAPVQILLTLLLNVSASFFCFTASMFYVSKFEKGQHMRGLHCLVSVVFGACIIGAGLLAHSGMKFSPKVTHGSISNKSNSGSSMQRAVLTTAIPVIISVTLASAALWLLICANNRPSSSNRNTCPSSSSPRLTLASIAFSHDGRVLVNQKGMLPSQKVDLAGLPEDVLEDLDPRRTTFHWLLAISSNWSTVSPFLSGIITSTSANSSSSASSDKRATSSRPSRYRHHASASISIPCVPMSLPVPLPAALLAFFQSRSSSSAVPAEATAAAAQATLKLRLLAASAQLASQLGLPLENLGTLHYRALETGSRIGIAELLRSSEQSERAAAALPTEQARLDTEAGPGIGLKDHADSRGLMLFFVRTLPPYLEEDRPRLDLRLPETKEARTAENRRDGPIVSISGILPRGTRMHFMGRVRDVFAETAGARTDDVDKILTGARNAATTRRSHSVLEAGCTYVSLFTEKVSCDGSSEVLVYDFAKHQLPSYKLDLHVLTREMRAWLRGMSGFTALDIIQICKHEVEEGRRHPRSLASSHSSYHSEAWSDYHEEEHRHVMLLHFKQALSTALVQLMRGMAFVGEELETWTYLTSHILDVPSSSSGSSTEGGVPEFAHMILLHAEHPDPLDVEEESDFSHRSFVRDSALRPTMPSIFEYIPRQLFDVIHALATSPPARQAFRAEVTREIDRLTTDATSNNTKYNQRAVSSLSSHRPGAGAGSVRLPRALVSSFSVDSIGLEDTGNRSTLARVRKSWVTLKSRARSLKFSSASQRKERNNGIQLSHSASRTQLLSSSHLSSHSFSSSIATTTRNSIIPEPPAFYLYSRSRSAVDLNRTSHVATATTASTSPRSSSGSRNRDDARSYGGSLGRSWTKTTTSSSKSSKSSVARSVRSDWEETTTPISAQIPLPVPSALPYRVPSSQSTTTGRARFDVATGNRAAWKSVPNVPATKSGFF